ncbi:MAG: glycosyltransferase [Tannerellaceae bacterium]
MSLLFFASDFEKGLTPYLVNQAIALSNAIPHVYVVSGENSVEENLDKKLKKANIPLYRFDGLDIHSNALSLSRELGRLIKINEIKSVHAQTNWQLFLVVLAQLLLLRKIQVIYTIHSYRHNSRFKSIFMRVFMQIYLFLFVDKVVCPSTFLADKFKLIRSKINIIPLGVDDEFFSCNSKNTSSLQIIFPAQFRKGKYHKELVQAFIEYLNTTNDKESKLYLPGTGELFNSIEDFVRQSGYSDQIILPGFLTKTELHEYFRRTNIGIIPTNVETFGFCIVEPYVSGKFVISRNTGIASDIIIHGKNGYLFDNIRELPNLLKAISEDKTLINNASFLNRTDAQRFRWKNIGKLYFEKII